MSKRWTVTCSGCKFYKIPLYCIETSGFHAKTCQLKKPYSCLCSKENEKGKDDVDSLSSLRNKRNCNDLDDKIKNLKSELTSLVKEDSKSEIQNNNNNNNNSDAKNIRTCSVIKHVHKSYRGNVSRSGGRVDVSSHHVMHKEMKHDIHSTKKDFTNWLDSTIDSLSGTPNSDGNQNEQIPDGNNKTLDTVVDENAECLIETNYLTQDWDDLQIAQELLYESFLIQNYPCYMTPVNDEVEALPINLTKRKHERTEGRNSSAKKSKRSDKTKNSDPTKQVNDKMMDQNRSDNEVEVIDIDDDSNNSSSEIKKVDCDENTEKVIVIEDNDTNPETEATEKENSDSKKRVWECPICFEQNAGQEVVTTMCGHVFCKKCLEDYYVTYEQSCPTCRTNLQDKPLITLFNF